ncbi:hypothetical protein [Clostridium sp. DL1XJH146]
MNTLWRFRLLIICELLFIAAFIAVIVLQERKKKKVKGDITVKCLSIFNLQLLSSIICLLFPITYLYLFLKGYYLERYSFFIPKYFDEWYELFNYSEIIKIENLLRLDKDNFYDFFMVSSYVVELYELYAVFFMLICIAISLYIGIQNVEITSNGVLQRKDLFLWKDIKEYKWKEPSKIIIQMDVRNYYKLELYIDDKNQNKKWLSIKPDKVTLDVKFEDKEKADKLLREKNIVSK